MNAEQYLESKRIKKLKFKLYTLYSLNILGELGLIFVCAMSDANMINVLIGAFMGVLLTNASYIQKELDQNGL